MTLNDNPLLALRADEAPPRAPHDSFRRMAMFAAIPISVFVLHATVFGTWIADDAGISFAYARNLAAGHGLVSQPGVTPVEGCMVPSMKAWPRFSTVRPGFTHRHHRSGVSQRE